MNLTSSVLICLDILLIQISNIIHLLRILKADQLNFTLTHCQRQKRPSPGGESCLKPSPMITISYLPKENVIAEDSEARDGKSFHDYDSSVMGLLCPGGFRKFRGVVTSRRYGWDS
jgi:hypothetical protein